MVILSQIILSKHFFPKLKESENYSEGSEDSPHMKRRSTLVKTCKAPLKFCLFVCSVVFRT